MAVLTSEDCLLEALELALVFLIQFTKSMSLLSVGRNKLQLGLLLRVVYWPPILAFCLLISGHDCFTLWTQWIPSQLLFVRVVLLWNVFFLCLCAWDFLLLCAHYSFKRLLSCWLLATSCHIFCLSWNALISLSTLKIHVLDIAILTDSYLFSKLKINHFMLCWLTWSNSICFYLCGWVGIFLFSLFWDRVSYSLGWPWTGYDFPVLCCCWGCVEQVSNILQSCVHTARPLPGIPGASTDTFRATVCMGWKGSTAPHDFPIILK